MTTSPSLDEFLSTARREFGFLVSEFRFTGQPDLRAYPNPFSVHYVSSSTAVAVDGTQWGFGLQVMLTCLAPPPDFPPSVPLWAIVEFRAPHEPQSVSGQLQQITLDASLLRLYAAEVLRGDFTCFPAAMRIVEHHLAEAAPPKPRSLP
jgi:hypothetical protein